MGKTIKKCKATNPPLSLYLLSVLPCLVLPCLALPCLAYTRCLSCPALPCLYLLCVPVSPWVPLSFVCIGLFPLSLPTCGLYALSGSGVSLSPSIRCCCPLCLSVPLGCFAPLFFLVFCVGFPLWRLLSLPGLFFAGCESVWLWFCVVLPVVLPWVALWSFGCLVVCFALVYACGFWRWCPWYCRALWAFLLVVVVLGLLDRCLGQPCAILGYFAVTGLLGF